MTADEARLVQQVCNSADNECHVCAGKLLEELCRYFPEHDGTFRAAYEEHYE